MYINITCLRNSEVKKRCAINTNYHCPKLKQTNQHGNTGSEY